MVGGSEGGGRMWACLGAPGVVIEVNIVYISVVVCGLLKTQ